MDGPNINKKFSSILAVELEEKHNIQFLDLGTCFLYSVYTAFSVGVKELSLMSISMTSTSFLSCQVQEGRIMHPLWGNRCCCRTHKKAFINKMGQHEIYMYSTDWTTLQNERVLSFLRKTKEFSQLNKAEYIWISNILKNTWQKPICLLYILCRGFWIIFAPISIWSSYDPCAIWWHVDLIDKFDEKVHQVEESIESQWRS